MRPETCFYPCGGPLLTLFLWLICSSGMLSQEYLFNTQVINVEDGLPHRSTFDIVQDKEGFIWVSTQGHISRYDGYTFKTYDQKFLGIFGGDPLFLALDKYDRLWFCGQNTTNSGLIDTRRDTVYDMEVISGGNFTSKDVVQINGSETNDVFITTRSGIIYRYDGDIEEIYRFPQPTLPFERLICKPLSDGSHWIFYHGEVIRVSNGSILKTIQLGETLEKKIIHHPYSIIKAAAASERGFLRLENDTLVPVPLKNPISDKAEGIIQINPDYICYSTGEALVIEDKQGDIIYSFDQFEQLGDQKLKYRNTLLDDQNILWITSINGLIKVTATKNPFEVFQTGNSMRGIFQDDRYLWTGGYFGNIRIDRISGMEEAYLLPYKKRHVFSFLKDDQGHIWMGTDKGVIIEYIPGQDRFVHHKLDKWVRCYQIFRNPLTKNYWIGTNNGLYAFDKNDKKISPHAMPIDATGVYVKQFHQNQKGIWLVSSKGLFLMDGEKEVIIKHYTREDGLPAENINHLYEDGEGIFWLATAKDGLVRWDIDKNTFTQYTSKDGLSNHTIYAVYEDEYKRLWLSSNYGLMSFDKNTSIVKTYLPQDGIAHKEFNTYSHFQAEDGTLYFGGLNGITKFHPKDIQREPPSEIPLHITDVQILEKGSETFTNKTSDYRTAKKIELKPDDRILTLEFALLNYELPDENRYAYKIEGHEDRWIHTDENKMSIIGLPYGKYNIIIKGKGVSTNWSNNVLTIPIHAKRPFYLQGYFIMTVLLIIIGAITAGVKWRVRKLKSDRKRLEAEVKKRTKQIAAQAEELKALDKAKTRFFSNITHEFRTPLTLVIGPVEQMLSEQLPASLKKRLQNIFKNAHNLLNLVNQLLDLSKLENKKMDVEISGGDIIAYSNELVNLLTPLADKKKLDLKFKSTLNEWKTHFDKDKWHKIVYNLLSNAIKFTPKEGSITIDLRQSHEANQEYILLEVKDTGIGIKKENLNKIFERFYQTDDSHIRTQDGSGIGLSLVKELVELQNGSISVVSEAGRGTTFTVKLPTIFPMIVKNRLRNLQLEGITQLPEAEPVTENKNAAGTSPEKKEKLELLIIEDNAEMRAYIRSCLEPMRYNISEAKDGAEGIEKAQAIVPDLIISDVMMPRKDGFEVVRAVRDHIATSHIPLILLTAKASLDSRLEGINRGADAYLTKPFSPQELALRVRKLIELRQLLQRRYKGDPPENGNNSVFQKEDAFITELKSYVLENIGKPNLKREDLCRHFAMSRMQLHRKMKSLINTAPADYVRSVRLEAAFKLIKKGGKNVTEVAYETGFSSPEYFARVFKKAYGIRPSEA